MKREFIAGMIVITSGCATFTPWAAGNTYLRLTLDSRTASCLLAIMGRLTSFSAFRNFQKGPGGGLVH